MSEENEDNAEHVMDELSRVMRDATSVVEFEVVYDTLIKIGIIIGKWRQFMLTQGFSHQWCEEACLILMHRYFDPRGDDNE